MLNLWELHDPGYRRELENEEVFRLYCITPSDTRVECESLGLEGVEMRAYGPTGIVRFHVPPRASVQLQMYLRCLCHRLYREGRLVSL